MSREVVIVSACRTVGSFNGTLKDTSSHVLGALVMEEA